MTEATAVAPLLPPASVDFNALHEACLAGATHEEALDRAIFPETVAMSADEAAARAAESVAAAPTLAGLNKAQLSDIATVEGVTFARDKDGTVIAFADATNDQMRDAIEAKRAGEPVEARTTSDAA
jgi:hypothetical protein